MERARTNVLGVGVDAVNIPLAIERIGTWLETGQGNYICVTGVHGVMESQGDVGLRRIHNGAGLVVPDGMPLVWLSWLQGFDWTDRVYGPDLMLAVCARSVTSGWRHFLYGGGEGVAERLEAALRGRFPGLRIVGTHTPPFRPLTVEEDREVCDLILATDPDIVWVGLSTPKQERWMKEHVHRLGETVLIGVGAAFDFHAGLKKQAPRWMQRLALEWLFRLMSEPRRLWRRYLRNNPEFLWLLLLQKLRLRRYPLC